MTATAQRAGPFSAQKKKSDVLWGEIALTDGAKEPGGFIWRERDSERWSFSSNRTLCHTAGVLGEYPKFSVYLAY